MPTSNRWEKFVNRRWNEAIDHDSNFEEFIMANNPEVPDFNEISLEEKERFLREKKYIGSGVKIDEIKNTLKTAISEDLNYSHVTDATQDEFEITNEDGTSLKYRIDGMVDEIFERLLSFMPNSSSVEVKKKCKLGGNGDGTSEPCNKGDIKNLKIKTLKEFIEEDGNYAISAKRSLDRIKHDNEKTKQSADVYDKLSSMDGVDDANKDEFRKTRDNLNQLIKNQPSDYSIYKSYKQNKIDNDKPNVDYNNLINKATKITNKVEDIYKKIYNELGAKPSNKTWGGRDIDEPLGDVYGDEKSRVYIKPNETYIDSPHGEIDITNGIRIEFLYVNKNQRGQGLGKQRLEQITKLADRYGVDLYLDAAPQDKDTSEEGLINLYKQFGFVFKGEKGQRKAKKSLKENRISTNVGYFDVDDTIAPSKDSLFVSHLEIKPELRGQGHFKELLNTISQEASKRGKNKIVFDPDITQGKDYLNKLISIYKHHGFDSDANDPSLLVKNLNEFNDPKYSKWKRDNVTYRGISDNTDDEGHNGGSAILGRGLYSVPASNKSMARTYGKLAFLVNAKPKKPKIFNTLNDWEIWFHNTLVFPVSKAKGKDYPDSRDFFASTNIETEMQKLGFDGIIIKGREMVNYKPEDVRYYYNENQLINYYENMVDGNINESVLLKENHRDDLKYGALMAMFTIPNWEKIVSIIDKDDVYDKPGFGLEEDPHVTLLYGFHDDVDGEEVLERITENLDGSIKAQLTNISIFESKEYDVVKFDVKSEMLHKLNKICKEFPFTSDFPEYHPHMTIAYVKKGKGKKYIEEFSRSYKIISKELVFSTKDKDQNKVKIDESLLLEKKSRFEILKDNKKPLTDDERKEVIDADAVWHFTGNDKPSPAVWKSVNKNGDVTYVVNTHRAYNTAKTLKGAISRYHKFIKSTA